MTVSLDTLVLCDEIVAMARRIAGGLAVDGETLAHDVLGKVGPRGHFLEEKHTLSHFREHHRPKLIDRQNYDGWVRSRVRTMNEPCTEKMHWILHNHYPPPSPEDVLRELDRMLKRWEENL